MDFTVLDLHIAAALDVSLYELRQRSRTLREETNRLAREVMEREARGPEDTAALANARRRPCPTNKSARRSPDSTRR